MNEYDHSNDDGREPWREWRDSDPTRLQIAFEVAAQQFAEDRAIPWLEFAGFERMHRLSRALIQMAGYPNFHDPLRRLLEKQIREERERREFEVWIFDDQIYFNENDESTMRLIDDYFKENPREEPETDGGEG
jgi:hypothetical protein